MRLLLAAMLLFGSLAAASSAQESTVTNGGEASALTCEGCPLFLPVPETPPTLRRISHVAETELTWNQYLAAVDDRACLLPRSDTAFSRQPSRDFDGHEALFRIDWPITSLGLAEVECYASWLARRLGRAVVVPKSAEWLWLARSGQQGVRFPWGNDAAAGTAAIGGWKARQAGMFADKAIAPYPDWGRGRYVHRHIPTMRVKQFSPTAWGLYDVLGNGWELTADVSDWQPAARPEGARPYPGAKRVRIVGQGWSVEDWQKQGLEGGPNYAIVHGGRYSTAVAVRYVVLNTAAP